MQKRVRSIARFAVLAGLGLGPLGVKPLILAQQPTTETTGQASGAPPEVSSKRPGSEAKDTSNKKKEDMTDVYSGTDARTGLGSLARDFLYDQKQIWTSPAKLEFTDAQWIIPIGGVSAAFFATDKDFSERLSTNPTTISHYKTISDAGVGALIGGAGGMWLLGHVKHNEHWSETGFLAGEAALNSLVAVETMKYTLRRERPYQGDGTGPFFQSGGTSFPSEHAAAAWAVAGVIAHEYPGPLTKIAVYSLATLVSVSRVKARQHFNSDVFVGGLIGDMIGQDIYTRRYDPGLGGEAWKSMREIVRGDGPLSPTSYGSPYVPLDSWVYPVLDRLAALGKIHSEVMGQRPWTRMECARLTEEAATESGDYADASDRAFGITALETEFAKEMEALEGGSNTQGQVESVYTRVTEIDGKPLADSYHFGQTIINDFGRPYEEGFNNVTGFSAYGTEGRYTIYVRGEYQHAPSAPAYSLPVREEIASVDLNPLQPAVPVAETNRFELLDTYVGTAMDNWQFTFGKQSLWWGTARGGAFLFSDNAEPIYMFRATRMAPFKLPWIFGYLGPMKLDLFFGKLSGNQFPPRPLIHGEKISFKPTPNLELGFSRTSEFGGVGRPMTLGSIWESYVAYGTSVNYTANKNPGKRTGGFDLSYKVPFVRDWLSIYADSLTPDDPNPIDAPRRAALDAGLYMPRLPYLAKLDLRFEAIYTDTPTGNAGFTTPGQGGQYVYFEQFYHDLYTNKGNLIGNWIGRDGSGYQGWTTYWFTPRNSLQFGFRHAKVDGQFIAGGETQNDASVSLNLQVRSNWSVSTGLQYERWLAPLLSPTTQTNWTSTVGITYWPKSWSK